jgi:hypothetical protein
MACALVPPTPNALTPASSGPSAGHGADSVAIRNGLAQRSSSGLGRAKFAVGTSLRWCSISAVLITPATPADWPVCPMLLFTAPSLQKPTSSVDSRNAAVSAATSIGSPTRVPVPCAST